MYLMRSWAALKGEIALVVAHWALALALVPTRDLVQLYGIGYVVQGVYLGLFFSLSHFHMPRLNDPAAPWPKMQVQSTSNWSAGAPFWRLASGFLNLQIEHHWAPAMPPENLSVVAPQARNSTPPPQAPVLSRDAAPPHRRFPPTRRCARCARSTSWRTWRRASGARCARRWGGCASPRWRSSRSARRTEPPARSALAAGEGSGCRLAPPGARGASIHSLRRWRLRHGAGGGRAGSARWM